MANKGMGNCCCGGCAEPPWDRENVIRHFIQPMQQFCCACIPKQICVTYLCGSGDYQVTSTAVIDLVRPCEPGDYKSVYRGEMPLNGRLVDIELAFQVDEYAQKCYFCLNSYALQITDDCLEITDEVRAILCPRIARCENEEPGYIEFSVYGECGLGPGVLRVSAASNTSIPPLPRPCDCPNPCEEYIPRCSTVCSGCSCICSSACITIVRGNEIYFNGPVGLCGTTYRTSTGFAISITADEYTNCCQLEITDLGPDITIHEPLSNVGPVPIGTAGNPCPSPTARWDFTDAYLPFPDNHVQVIFSCAPCGNCQGVVIRNCCPTVERLPTVLKATIEGGPNCCGTIELNLIYDTIEGAWIGEDGNAMCGHAIALRLSCGSSWTLGFTGSPCTPQVVSQYGTSGGCDPLDLEFRVPAQGIGCCSGFFSGTLIITITE
jgi:hypothetical protein